MARIRVSVYEDNAQLSETLGWIIESGDQLLLTGCHPDALRVAEEVAKELPDVILMDIEMPHISGIEALRQISQRAPYMPKVLMFTVFEDTEKIF